MNTVTQDLRYALRALTRRPGFTAIAVVTLALGIGPTTAIFSVLDTLMLRPLPYPGADRIVTLWQHDTREGVPRGEVAPANSFDWRERSTAFDLMAAADPWAFSLITPEGRPEAVPAVRVTERFFEVLGIDAHRGRLFAPEQHTPGAGNFAVITYAMWQSRFGGDPDLVGSSLSLDGQPFVVLGVLPPEFELGLFPLDDPGELSIWVPLQEQGWERQSRRRSGYWNVIARLKPGVTLQQAQADMDRVSRALAVEYPATNDGVGVTVLPLREHLVAGARTTLLVLLGAVALVTLVACANVANLLIARGAERQHEFAVRTALGAGRGRLVRQLLAESLPLGLAGGLLGLGIAHLGVELIKALAPGDVPRLDTVAVDLRVLGFAITLSLFTAVFAGLAPAVQCTRPDPDGALKGARTTAGRAHLRLRGALIAGEIALALTLLVGAGLLIRSLAAIVNVDPGFRKENVLALQVFAYDRNPSAEERVRFFDETLRRIEATPGVVTAGAVSAGPFTAADIAVRVSFVVEGQPLPRPGEEPQVFVSHATPGYFRTLGIPLLRGRMFDETDRLGAPATAVINETLRRRYWPGEDPVGKRVLLGSAQTPVEIIGMVGDVRLRGLDSDPRPEIYRAQPQTGSGGMTYFVRTQGDPAAMLEAIKREVWAVDPLQDFYQTATLQGLVSGTLAARRFSLILLGIFAATALVMSAVGLYGVISFTLSRRTHELGIRMALGADRGHVIALVLRQGMALALGGLLLGLLGSLAATRALQSMLYGVTPRDGVTLAAAGTLLLGVTLLACYLPARRAAGMDPTEALRHE